MSCSMPMVRPIECNPRATSGIQLMAGDGQLARAIAEGTGAPKKAISTSHLGPAMLVSGLPRGIAKGELAAWRACLSAGPGDILGVRLHRLWKGERLEEGADPAVGAEL